MREVKKELISVVEVEKENVHKDLYIQDENFLSNTELLTNKKKNMNYWVEIEDVAMESIVTIAGYIGINIKEWGDEDAIKEVTEKIVSVIENRFDVKFPIINENH